MRTLINLPEVDIASISAYFYVACRVFILYVGLSEHFRDRTEFARLSICTDRFLSDSERIVEPHSMFMSPWMR